MAGCVSSNSHNLWAGNESAFAGAVKRKWRRRLERCGVRLAMTPALDWQRQRKPDEYIELYHFAGGR